MKILLAAQSILEELQEIRRGVNQTPLHDLEREAWEALDNLAPHDAQKLRNLRIKLQLLEKEGEEDDRT